MWFTENPWPPIIIAGLLALIFLVLWNSRRQARYLAVAVALILLGVGFYFLERAIVTEGERLQQLTVQLCEDFRTKKPVLQYVSDGNPKLKALFTAAVATINIHSDLRLSDFQSTVTSGNNEGTVHFRANATVDFMGNNVGYQPARLILTYRREKGEWKLTDVKRLNPINGREMALLEPSAG